MGRNQHGLADDSAAPPEARDPRRTLREALIVTALALLGTVLLLNLWNADLAVPFEYGGDANFYAGLTKTLDAHPWYLDTPELGWPIGSQLYDLPLGDENVQFGALKILTLFTGWAEAMNLSFILSFPVVALAAYFVARRHARFSVGIALAIALLYTFLPYHFARGVSHLPFVNYATVPLACALILSTADGRIAWPPWRMPARRLLPTVAVCVLLGSTSAYYAIFTGLLLVGTSGLATLATRDWRRVATGAVVAGALGAVLLINLTPSFLYWAANGRHQIGERPAADSERYGLRTAELVLPIADHRLPPLADLGQRARSESAIPGEHGAGLGLVGTTGLVAALGAALVHGARRREGEPDPAEPPDPAALGAPILIALLIALVGGLAFVMALFGFNYLRGWNRISVFIGFFALLATGHLLRRFAGWVRNRGLPRAAFPVLLGIVVIVGLLDQTPVHPVPSYKETARRFGADADFVHDVEQRLGPGSAVFQLPIVGYPEAGPTEQMADYDHLRGYLHSDDLRWSYGGSKGRDDIWLQELRWLKPLPLATAAAAIGFDAMWIDRAGFADPFKVEDALAAPLGQPILSADRRVAVYQLEPFLQGLQRELGAEAVARVRDVALHPVTQRLGLGFLAPFNDRVSPWAESAAVLHVHNPGKSPRAVVLTGRLVDAPEAVHIDWADGSAVVPAAPPGATPTKVEVRLSILPGDSEIRLSTDAPSRALPDGRAAAFRILELDVVDAGPRDAARKIDPSLDSSGG